MRIGVALTACLMIIAADLGFSREAPQALLGNVTRITSPAAGDLSTQMWADSDPAEPYLIVCGVMRDPRDNVLAGYVYSSPDAGATWRRTLLDNSSRWVSEESCTYGFHGHAYFTAGVSNFYHGSAHHDTGHLHVYASTDHGMTWHRIYMRAEGWLDWAYLADLPRVTGSTLVVFGNSGTDRLGHWFPARPVAITSTNGGHTFSKLLAQQKYQRTATWTGGSAILPDGTALFVVNREHSKAEEAFLPKNTADLVQVFAYDPRDNALTLRYTLDAHRWLPNFFPPSLAQDRSGGKFNGRLYAAWIVTDLKSPNGGTSTVHLAISDDRGFHWSSRTVLRSVGMLLPAACGNASVFNEVHLAVNKKGILGILWSENARDLLFASSHDGGQTFNSSMIVAASTQPSGLWIQEVFPHDDYWQAEERQFGTGESDARLERSEAVPGLAVVLGPGENLDSAFSALITDIHGTFHAFWPGPRKDTGGDALYTRNILALTTTKIPRSTLADPLEPNSCLVLPVNHGTPVFPNPPSVFAVPYGQRDVTSSIAINPVRYQYNAAAHRIAVDAEIVNKGKASLILPLMIVATNLHSDFGTLVALNAHDRFHGYPLWHATNRRVHFVFRIVNFHISRLLYYGYGDGVAMKLRFYENRSTRF